jgi:hypothetical protein
MMFFSFFSFLKAPLVFLFSLNSKPVLTSRPRETEVKPLSLKRSARLIAYERKEKQGEKSLKKPRLYSFLIKSLAYRLKGLRPIKSSPELDIELIDYKSLIKLWELEEPKSLNRCQRELRLRIIFLALIGLATLYLAFLKSSFVVGLIVPIPAVLGILTALWRLSILKNKRFLSLSAWLRLSQLSSKKS